MHKLIRYSTVSLLLLCASTVQSDEVATKIRFVSPDQKFAMCIRYGAEANKSLGEAHADAPRDMIYSDAVQEVEIVALPNKESVEHLLGERAGGFSLDNIALMWSPDSKAFVFRLSENRVDNVVIEELRGGKFVVANEPDELEVHRRCGFGRCVGSNRACCC